MMNINGWIDKWALESPEKKALDFEGQTISYSEFSEKIDACCLYLNSLNIQKGDHIAYLGYNSPDFLYLMFACGLMGAVILPINWRLAPEEQDYILKDARAKLLFIGEGYKGARPINLDSAPYDIIDLNSGRLGKSAVNAPQSSENPHKSCPNYEDTPLLLIYSSGTTGRPKGVLLTHRSIQANAINSMEMHDLTSDDHVLIGLPFFHVGGLNILTTPIFFVGGSISLQAVFMPDQYLDAMIEVQPTRVALVSAQMPPLFKGKKWPSADLSFIRSVTTGASPVSAEIFRGWQAKGVAVLQVYGSTETCPIAIHTSLHKEYPNIETVGRPAKKCQVKITGPDDLKVPCGKAGEILIKGDNVTLGYWQNIPATKDAISNGWYATGDMGYQDAEGFYYIVDRKKDMIISGGENIYPAELERVLIECPLISDAAVIGKPDPKWGEVPVAIVQVATEKILSKKNVMDLFHEKLGRYKHPKDVYFTDEFPRNSMGKIQKFQLKKQLLNGTIS